MVAFILLVIVVLIIGFTVKVTKMQKESRNKEIHEWTTALSLGNEISRYNVKYLGGHPFLTQPGSAVISLRETGFVLTMIGGVQSHGGKYNILSDVEANTEVQYDHRHKPRNINILRFNVVVEGKIYRVSLETQFAGRIASMMNRGIMASHT